MNMWTPKQKKRAGCTAFVKHEPKWQPFTTYTFPGVTFMGGCYTSSYDVSHRDKYSVSLLLFPCALRLSQDVLTGAGIQCDRLLCLGRH